MSIGSEDRVVAWLNGKPLVFTGAGTRQALERVTVTLDLREGANDLSIKMAHRKGKWNFYFNPTVSDRFQVKLDRLLDRDFPPTRRRPALSHREFAAAARHVGGGGRTGVSA